MSRPKKSRRWMRRMYSRIYGILAPYRDIDISREALWRRYPETNHGLVLACRDKTTMGVPKGRLEGIKRTLESHALPILIRKSSDVQGNETLCVSVDMWS